MVYPPELGIDPYVSTCGILMGLPLTWVTLNLMQLFWTDLAFEESGVNKKLSLKTTVICGDDLGGHWKQRTIDAYNSIVVRSNGLPSKGKHFCSADRIVYTEIMLAVSHPKVTTVRIQPVHADLAYAQI